LSDVDSDSQPDDSAHLKQQEHQPAAQENMSASAIPERHEEDGHEHEGM
jgi:hypothetical protein